MLAVVVDSEFERYHDTCVSSASDAGFPADGADVMKTWRYVCAKAGKGLFVKYGADGRLFQFVAFESTADNEWSGRVDAAAAASVLRDAAAALKSRVPELEEPRRWRANNGLIRCEKPHVEHYHNVEILMDMLGHVAAPPGLEFFVNKRDFPLVSSGRYEPYYEIYGERHPLVSHAYERMAPVFGFSTTDGYDDLLLPSYEDWARARCLEDGVSFPQLYRDYRFERTGWRDKRPVAVFRGSATAAYRVDVVRECKRFPHLFDVEITKNNCRLRCRPDGSFYYLDYRPKPWMKMTLTEQYRNKFILHLDGHVSAYRLGSELSSGSCIIKVANPEREWRCWFSHLLRPFEHYIPATVGTLAETVEWCLANDGACERIASRALEFYAERLTKRAMIDYLTSTLAAVGGRYSYPPVRYDVFAASVIGEPIPENEWLVHSSRNPDWLLPPGDVDAALLNAMIDHVEYVYCATFSGVVVGRRLWNAPVTVTTEDADWYCDHVEYLPVIVYDRIWFVGANGHTNYTAAPPPTANDVLRRPVVRGIGPPKCRRRAPAPSALITAASEDAIYRNMFPANETTNKLFVYRQLQVLGDSAPSAAAVYRRLLEKIPASRLNFCVDDSMIAFDGDRLNYAPHSIQSPDVVDDCTGYRRLLRETLTAVTPRDLHFYTEMFNPLFSASRLSCGASAAVRRTVSLFLRHIASINECGRASLPGAIGKQG